MRYRKHELFITHYHTKGNGMFLSRNAIFSLEEQALAVREHCIRMAQKGGCFLGASLSCADLLVYLYNEYMRISPASINNPDRDVLLLSKGHDVPALYGVLAELGYIDRERLNNHLLPGDHLYWHPNRNIPGVEFHSGSLGHLLSVGAGIALDAKLRKSTARIIVIVGDGELNEGSVWEAALVAAAHRLDNLLVVVDRNQFQANMRTEDLIPLEPLDAKWRSFGWHATSVDGHDFEKLDAAFSALPALSSGIPSVVIAHTTRGKGLPSIEERADRWFCNFSEKEVEDLIRELHGVAHAEITSETLIVR